MRAIRSTILPLFVFGLTAAAACVVQDKDDDEGGAGGSGASPGQSGSAGTPSAGGTGGRPAAGSSGGGTATPGEKGWAAVPLIDDERDPENIAYHAGNDTVTGIYFNAIDDGFVTTNSSPQTRAGGALFRAKHKQVTAVLLDGNAHTCLAGDTNYNGIVKTSKGYVALAHSCDYFSSDDGGATFGVKTAGVPDSFGIQRAITYRETATGGLLVTDSAEVAVSNAPPNPNAIWDDTWAPDGNPSIPNPLPDDQCQRGPRSPLNPKLSQTAYVSPDAKFIAYTATFEDAPQICVSTDGGKSFYPKLLPDVPEDERPFPPAGVTFVNATTGITWYANNIYQGQGYIYRTTDAGNTWARVPLPADVAPKGLELMGASFAPDGLHGWIAGFNYSNSIALLLKTSDGGATWSADSGDLATKVSLAGGGKLRAVFALDEYHLWVGGERGMLLANDAGGQ